MKHLEKVALAKALAGPGIAGGVGAALGSQLPVSDKMNELADNPELIQALLTGGLGAGMFAGGAGGRALANKLVPSMRMAKSAPNALGGTKVTGVDQGKLNAIAKLLGMGAGATGGGIGGGYLGALAGVLSDDTMIDNVKRQAKEKSKLALT